MEITERHASDDYLPGHELIVRRTSSIGTPPSFSQEASASSTAASNSGEAVKERPSSNRPAVCQMVSRSSGGRAGNSARISDFRCAHCAILMSNRSFMKGKRMRVEDG